MRVHTVTPSAPALHDHLFQVLTFLFSLVLRYWHALWTAIGTSMVTKDIIQLIQEDHNRVRELYNQYRLAGNTLDQKRVLMLDIIRFSSIHFKREDMVLPAALQAHTGLEGCGLLVGQHQHLEEEMELLLQTPVWQPHFDTLLQEFMLDLEHHLQQEEDELLPQLQTQLSPEQLMQLGRDFEWAKLIAPSRPHSWAPKTPLLSHIVCALLAPLDFMQDMIAYAGAPTL